MRFWNAAVLTFCLLPPFCFPQGRPVPRTQLPRAPFLQQAKSYEETAYVTKVVFRNGMTVLVDEYRAQPVVSLQAYVGAGFLDEPAKEIGVARLLERMAFRGKTGTKSTSISQDVHALGGILRSSTDCDFTRFEIVVPSLQWKRALNIQASIFLNPSLDRDQLGREAEVLIRDARGFLDDPCEFAVDKLLELGFDQQRMGKWSSISGGALHDLGLGDLAEFQKGVYVPSKLLLVISGDVSASEVLNEVARLYGEAPAGASRASDHSPDAPGAGFRYSGLRGNAAIPLVLLGFRVAPADSEDYPALEILSAILGNGDASVLAARLRDQKKVILSEQTNLLGYKDFGYLVIRMEVDQKDIDRCEIAAFTELELLKLQEPGDADMRRALAGLERAYWTKLETVSGRAENLAHFESLGDWKNMNSYISRLKRVKPADVKRIAAKYLRLDYSSLLEYLPVAAEQRSLSAETARRTIEGLLPPSVSQERAERERETVRVLKSPSESGGFKFSEMRYQSKVASILRGPDLFIREDHTSPLIEMGFFFPGGKFFENKENSGITELMLKLMLQNANSRSSGEFSRQLELYGGRIRPVVNDDYFGVFFSILSGNIEPGLDLIIEAFKSAKFEGDEIARQKQLQVPEIRRRKSSDRYPRQVINRALFDDASYALDPGGTEASLTSISAEALQSWYDMHVKNRKPVIAIVGDTIGTSLASYFVRYFSGSRFSEVRLPDQFAKALGEGALLDDKWDENRSVVAIGFQGPPEEDEDGVTMRVLQGYVEGRKIFLRETSDRHVSNYDLALSYEPRLRGGSAVVSAAAIPGSEEAVLKELKDEIQHLITGEFVYRDYRSAVNAAVGSCQIKRQYRSAQIAAIVEGALAGKGIEQYEEFPNRLQEVKMEDLTALARQVFRMEKAVILRLRGQSPSE